ncbi:MAG: hypothetical protein HY720_06550 [Planctomycetes bacterium]|nr:hypothetical protein [Planctomycetota bacterium]
MTRAALVLAFLATGCTLPMRDSPEPRSSEPADLLAIEEVDDSSFPEILVRIRVRDLAGRPVNDLERDEIVVRGPSLETIRSAWVDTPTGEFTLTLRDNDFDPEHLTRRLEVSYQDRDPPYFGSNRVVEYSPDPSKIRWTLAENLPEYEDSIRRALAEGQDDAALARLAWLLARLPGNSALGALLAGPFLDRFRSLVDSGDLDQAIDFIDRLAGLAPEPERYRRLQAQALLRKAIELPPGAHRFESFAALLERALALSPDDPTLPAALADESLAGAREGLESGEFSSALAALERAREILAARAPDRLPLVDAALSIADRSIFLAPALRALAALGPDLPQDSWPALPLPSDVRVLRLVESGAVVRSTDPAEVGQTLPDDLFPSVPAGETSHVSASLADPHAPDRGEERVSLGRDDAARLAALLLSSSSTAAADPAAAITRLGWALLQSGPGFVYALLDGPPGRFAYPADFDPPDPAVASALFEEHSAPSGPSTLRLGWRTRR